ncbi:MAG: phosphotransferase, partial [Mycolicibacterium frederiksbergense]|nr:phosphotransferase [Mycolicibacterium frederiksbergense]
MNDVAGFNFLEQPALPAAQVTEQQAAELLADRYGSRGEVTSLGSQQDCNFLVSEDGVPVAVLKIANPAFTETELAAQDAAAELIARTHPDLRVATPLPTVDGEPAQGVRLLPYLAGGTLTERGYLTPSTVAAMGDLAARVSRALDGFSHPGLDRALQWDLRYGKDVVDRLIAHAPRQRDEIQTAAREAWVRIAPHADDLPRQAVHLDLTDANVVAGPSGLPDGIIDFGDLSHTWAISELAITLSSVLGHPGSDP